ncbi:MAG: glycosyltransferase family 4 protein [Acidobacteria bacterium]|nr:glycosyltransferase family 4 protein [Acidobacteriota bacterium]
MKLSVLLVGNFLSSSTGVRSVCEDLAMQLAGKGWPIFTSSAKPGRIARVSDMVSTVWRERRRYDIAHVEVYSGPAFIWAELVCESLKLVGKPFVLTLHSGSLPVFAERWPGRMRRLLNSAVVVTTPSTFLGERMKQFRADLQLLPNPIELGAYRFKHRKKVAPKLIWLRAFHKIYNPSLAPRVIARLREEFPDIHLTMVGRDKGDGSLQETLQVAKMLGVADQISFSGAIPKSEVPVWLGRHDIFLNTTNVDNMPVSILEAMASGLCVVSTNVGGIPRLLEQEHEALLVSADDIDAMTSSVRRLLTDDELAATLSYNARQKAGQFDWAVILPQWERILAGAAVMHKDG